MKKMLFLLSLLSLCHQSHADQYTATKDSSWTSAEITFQNQTGYKGKVVRSGFLTQRYYYDLYREDDTFAARGVTRFFSLGSIFPWAIEIDVYDKGGGKIGKIEGQYFTKARAKYIFFNHNDLPVANAYLNDEECNFLIVSAANEKEQLGSLVRSAYGDVDYWDLQVDAKVPFDKRLFRVFAGFVADYAQSFVQERYQIVIQPGAQTNGDNLRGDQLDLLNQEKSD